jgi:hypothetical protein
MQQLLEKQKDLKTMCLCFADLNSLYFPTTLMKMVGEITGSL